MDSKERKMNRPCLSQGATVADYKAAFAEWQTQAYDFSNLVDARVEEQFNLTDGGDLCYNFLEQGTISLHLSVDEAARIVAQNITQA
jgi:hypothetical protein